MWLVFIYSTYYPRGGIKDLVNGFTTEDQCQDEIRGVYRNALFPDNFNAHYCHTSDVRFIHVYDEETDSFKLESIDPEH